MRFVVVEEWSGVVQPTRSSSGGMNTVTLSGYGFDKTSDQYECVFGSSWPVAAGAWTGGGSPYQRLPAKPLSSTRVICETPLNVSFSGSTYLRLVRSGEVVSQATAPFLFYTVWAGVSPSLVSAGGGTILHVSGFGFDKNMQYRCNFTSHSASTTILVSATYETQYLLTCVTPEWNSTIVLHSWFSLTFGTSKSELVEMHLSSHVRKAFAFASEWIDKGVNADLAKGGARITVLGHAFQSPDTSVSYVCAFRRWLPNVVNVDASNASNGSQMVGMENASIEAISNVAMVLNRSILTCLTPHWLYNAGKANFSIRRIGAGPEVLTQQDANSDFTFFSGWDTTSETTPATQPLTRARGQSQVPVLGSAGGMDIIWIKGYGFDTKSIYTCIFFRPKQWVNQSCRAGWQTSPTSTSPTSRPNKNGLCPGPVAAGVEEIAGRATVYNSTSVACVTPSWGTQYVPDHPTYTSNVPEDFYGLVAFELRKDGFLVNFTAGNQGLGVAEISLDRDDWYHYCAVTPSRPCRFRFQVTWTADGTGGTPLLDASYPATTPSSFPAGGGHPIQ